jgi:molybdate transport system substrate-binding protein
MLKKQKKSITAFLARQRRRTVKIFLTKYFIVLTALLFLLNGCGSSDKKELSISAAASLQGTMKIVKKEYEKKHPDVKLTFNYGSSGMLQRQIEQGAPVDVFLSASPVHTEALKRKSLLLKGTGQPFVKNTLVLITSQKRDFSGIEGLLKNKGEIAIGTPGAVPAGDYARSAFKSLGVWGTLKNRLIFAKDVRHVLTLVEQDSTSAGVVYKSDALSSQKVQILEEFDRNLYSDIDYTSGVAAGSSKKKEALAFLKYLKQPHIQKLFAQQGFTPLNKQH